MIDQSSLPEGDFEAIVEAGLLAPSADNRHEVSFRLDGSSIEVWAKGPRGAIPRYRHVLQLIGLGAMAENMRLRARRLGWAGHLTRQPLTSEPALIARMDFTRTVPKSDDLDGSIEDRHTNRALPFRGPSLSVAQRDSLQAEAAGMGNARLLWLDDRRTRQTVARLAWMAEAERLSSKALHAELFSSIRFDVGWKESADTGLPPGTLGIAPPLRPVFALLRSPKAASIVKRLGVHWVFGIRSGYLPCMLTPHLAVVAVETGSDRVEDAAWEAGGALERIWLRAESLGLALQPLAAPAIYALSGGEVADGLTRTLAETWARILPDIRPLLLVRMGHAPRAVIRAGRPRTEEHVLQPHKKEGPAS